MKGSKEENLTELDPKEVEEKLRLFHSMGKGVFMYLKDGQWLRGFIKEFHTNYFLLQEFILGDMPVFYREVASLTKLREKEEHDHKTP